MGGGSGGGGWSRLGDIRSLEQKAKEALQQGRRNIFISFAFEDIDEVNRYGHKQRTKIAISNSMTDQFRNLMRASGRTT